MRFTDALFAAAATSGATAAATGPEAQGLGARQAANTITVDLTKTYQTMDGFGFSTAFQRGNLITNLSNKKVQRELLDLLFNRTTGAGFSIIRTGIGSSPDSSSDHMNTFAPKNPGGPTAAPQYQWDGKDSGQLFVCQEAVKTYGVRAIYADAWSAPGYMKTNNNENNGGTLCGMPGAATCQSGDWRQAYASYLAAYVRFYREAGVNVTHLGFLNEPEFAASYASMSANGNQAADFIKVLHATLVAENLTDTTGIACCDSEGWGNQVNMMNSIRSAGAEDLMKAVTSHTYTGGSSGAMNTKVPVWLSEQCDLQGAWTTAWYSSGGAGDGLTWANNIYSAVVNTGVSGYLYWEGVQWPNPNTNEKIIKVDNATNTYEVANRLWAFANWSRYVRPGAVRVGSSGGGGGSVKTAAFKNLDGSIAVVAINTGASASPVSVKVAGAGEARAWVSDNTHKCEETTVTVGSDGAVAGSLPARSIVTFVITPAAAAAPAAEGGGDA
ncbi:glycoside hydrolase superfamily [Phialemonium atrogriseum]|uniref:Glycoside hydrolase superfamily n=1 Tax=Phialemonium atrogriseum TaxID=1093897 RepID=A0AAJ0C3C3_9PEZI|nr:glycoside hydrolase superfamily [Phialemonium atrogriseum]KAK1769171.1 glycoside hydrolase superfamily [Phialemonium atrogriseum]